MASPQPKGRTTSVATTYVEEFNVHFEGEKNFATKAKTRSINGGLRQSNFRSLYWKLFLEILSSNALSDWPSDMKKARDEYTALRAKFTSNPAAVEGDLKVNNPLSTAKDNTWQSYFADNDLMEVIKLDIKRTHQENEFFIKPETQSIMLNILFTWAKQNPAYGYRQGMNELLAPIILAVNRDSRPVDSTKTDTASLLLDKRFVEHDTFCIFDKVMNIMAKYFVKVEVKKIDQKEKEAAKAAREKAKILGLAPNSSDAPAPPVTVETPIVKKCGYIHNTLLAFYDQLLYRHLNELDVQPTVYSLRWSRLLFAQEFHIEDVMTLWDVLFAYTQSPITEHGIVLADYMCVSMLLYVRKHLMQPDVNFVLKRLMKYPPVEDIRILVERAVELSKIPLSSTPLPPYVEPVSPTAAAPPPTPYQQHQQQPQQQPQRPAPKKDFLSSILDPLSDLTKKIGDAVTGPSHGNNRPSQNQPNRSAPPPQQHQQPQFQQPRPSQTYQPQPPPPQYNYQHQPQQQQARASQPHPQLPSAGFASAPQGRGITAGPRPSAPNTQFLSSAQQQPPNPAKDAADLRTTMQEMGGALTAIIDRLALEVGTPEPTPASAAAAAAGDKRMITVSEDMILTSLAELKHIKDVLMGRLSAQEILSHLAANRRAGNLPNQIIAPPGTGTASAAATTNGPTSPHPAQAQTNFLITPSPAAASSPTANGNANGNGTAPSASVTVLKPNETANTNSAAAKPKSSAPPTTASGAVFDDPLSSIFGANSPQAQSITPKANGAKPSAPAPSGAAAAPPPPKPKSNTSDLFGSLTGDDPFENPLKARAPLR